MTPESIAEPDGGVQISPYWHGSSASFASSAGQGSSCLGSSTIVSSAHSSPASSRLPGSWGKEDIEAAPQDSVDTEDLYLKGGSQDTSSPVKSGMEEVHYALKALGIHSHSIRVAAIPPEDMTTEAVKAFLYGTGSLLYFWSEDEALNLIRSVYHPQSDSTPAYATEVFAMSAVGSCCDGDAHTMLLQETFLHFFLYMLSSPSDMSDLRRMRLFACLAICRFTNSTDNARRLMCK